MSADLQWECMRKFTSCMVKRNGVVFSTEAGNLTNKHSKKASGLLGARTVRVAASATGITVSHRLTKAGSKVAASFSKPVAFKATLGHKSVAAKVAKHLDAAFYRRDLVEAAKARAVAIVKSQN